jgi:hypothetical protein
MTTSFPNSPEPSIKTFVEVGEKGVPSSVILVSKVKKNFYSLREKRRMSVFLASSLGEI